MLDFDSINHDGSIFEDDPDSETENAKGNQEHGKNLVRWNLHNGPLTCSLDREIQIHQEKQHSNSDNQASNENNIMSQNQMMETLAGALSNILKEERRNPRDHQREVTTNINFTIEELNKLQEEIIKLPYEEVGETRLNDLMSIAKELSEKLKRLRLQAKKKTRKKRSHKSH